MYAISMEQLRKTHEDVHLSKRRNKRRTIRILNHNQYSIIIPYDFGKNKYYVDEHYLEPYMHVEHIANKLREFGENPLFDIEKPLELKGFWKYFLYLPNVILTIAIFYVVIFSALSFMFNPAILIITYFSLEALYDLLQKKRFIYCENLKKKRIKEYLDKENNSAFSIEHNLIWELGQSGYWIELHKNRKETEKKKDDNSFENKTKQQEDTGN